MQAKHKQETYSNKFIVIFHNIFLTDFWIALYIYIQNHLF